MPSLVLKKLGIFAFILALFFQAGSAFAQEGDASRGAYLAKLGDCEACHTAPQHPAFAGGLPINSPLGTIYSTNITPDPQYGIGKYSLEDFKRAVRQGLAKDGKHLYPAMPYTSYVLMSDQDVNDLYAYFMKEVAPVHAEPPKTKLVFPFNQRWGITFWDMVFAPRERYRPDKGKDAQWNRGAYIVQSLGHCGACHTPRNLAYAEKSYSEASPAYLSGQIFDNWFAADLRELNGWSEDDIVSFLKNGFGHGSTVFGSMKQVVEDSTQYLNEADLRAVAHYLVSIQLKRVNPAVASGTTQWPGAGLYHSACASCHKANGEGEDGKYPRLAGNTIVLSDDPISPIRLVLEGGKPARTQSRPNPKGMPAFAGKLTDKEIADVLSYIRNSWGNKAKPVSPRDVMLLRKMLHLHPFPVRDNQDTDGAHHRP